MGDPKDVDVIGPIDHPDQAKTDLPGVDLGTSGDIGVIQNRVLDNSELSARPSVEELYSKYDRLLELGWNKKVIGTVDGVDLLAYYKGKSGDKALWIISGTHGNEPAGPIAMAENIETLDKLSGKGIPVVLLPLCNPWGYSKNTQFPTTGEGERCISDVRYLLPGHQGEKAVSPYAEALGQGVSDLIKEHPAGLVVDHHEDRMLKRNEPWQFYLFSIGKKGRNDEGVQLLRDELSKNLGVTLPLNCSTRDGNIVDNVEESDDIAPLHTLLMSSASTGIIVETQSNVVPLDARVGIHSNVLEKLEGVWNKVIERDSK